jgi:hypothetical protein
MDKLSVNKDKLDYAFNFFIFRELGLSFRSSLDFYLTCLVIEPVPEYI